MDETGFTSKYSFVLYFSPDLPNQGPNPGDASDPGIFAAVQQQLGLRLEARKAPVEMLLIDHAEKAPTGN
jgi:uncharacterized protein (TIGR03435 family)